MTATLMVPARSGVRPAVRGASRAGSRIGLGIILLFAANVPLALLMYRVSIVATIHAFATLAVGLGLAAFGRRNLFRVACVGAYIAGSEVLWRMANAQVFWEFGKYATATIFIVAILRNRNAKGLALPLLFFALLLPSAALTLANVDLLTARRALSFNLSGPLALATCMLFFLQLKVSIRRLQRLFLVLAGPLLGLAAVTLFAMPSGDDLVFTGESNFATSGGFGPNQVSAALGLGALTAFLFILLGDASRKVKILIFCAMTFMVVQSAMTFSRGGLYCAGGAAVFGSLYLLKDRGARLRFLIVVPIFVILASYVLLPALDSFTSGALSARFQDTNTTNRYDIAMAQLRAFSENPVMGVGPGRARAYARESAHAEFTRLVAEHGILGLIAMVLLFVAGSRALRAATGAKEKAFAAAMMSWGILFMLTSGMRLLAPALAFGLAFALIVPERRFLRQGSRRRPQRGVLARAGRHNNRTGVRSSGSESGSGSADPGADSERTVRWTPVQPSDA